MSWWYLDEKHHSGLIFNHSEAIMRIINLSWERRTVMEDGWGESDCVYVDYSRWDASGSIASVEPRKKMSYIFIQKLQFSSRCDWYNRALNGRVFGHFGEDSASSFGHCGGACVLCHHHLLWYPLNCRASAWCPMMHCIYTLFIVSPDQVAHPWPSRCRRRQSPHSHAQQSMPLSTSAMDSLSKIACGMLCEWVALRWMIASNWACRHFVVQQAYTCLPVTLLNFKNFPSIIYYHCHTIAHLSIDFVSLVQKIKELAHTTISLAFDLRRLSPQRENKLFGIH